MVSCKKDDSASAKNHPPLTSAEEISFSAVYSEGGSYDYTIRGWATPGLFGGSHVNGDGYSGDVDIVIGINNPVEEGVTYQLDSIEAGISFSNRALLKMWYATGGTVTITEKDEAHHILRGTFDATVYNDGYRILPQGGHVYDDPSTYHLENGTFDVYYAE